MNGPRILMDPETERRADLIKRLSMYRLRSKVKIVDLAAEWVVVVFWGAGALKKLGLAPDRDRDGGWARGVRPLSGDDAPLSGNVAGLRPGRAAGGGDRSKNQRGERKRRQQSCEDPHLSGRPS